MEENNVKHLEENNQQGPNQGGTTMQTEQKSKPEFSPEQQELVNKIVARELAKMQSKTEKKIAEIQEAEKLKNMSEEERRQAELEAYKQKVADFEKQQLVNQFKVELTEKGLPSKYADIIPVTDAESAKTAVEFLSTYVADIKKSYESKISELEDKLKNAELRGEPPKNPSLADGTGFAKSGQKSNKTWLSVNH